MIAPELEGYIRRSNDYWRQGQEHSAQGHFEKASELAWGSVVERIKALAFARGGIQLRSHRELRDYIKRVAQQSNDRDLYDTFRRSESLHINFYESFFDPEDVTEALLSVEQLLPKIDALLMR